MVEIRRYRASDWESLWPILRETVAAGDTLAHAPESGEGEIRRAWVEEPAAAFVACEEEGAVLGAYFIRPSQPGRGAHVSNCGYVVAPHARGRGIASRMCEHSQAQAIAMGFTAMQFSFVVATNEPAVRLWRKLGFSVVGRLPGAFRHRELGPVDALVMFKRLTS